MSSDVISTLEVAATSRHTTRKWTQEEVAALLSYWSTHVVPYKTKSKKFYDEVSKLPVIRKTSDQIKSKCSDIEKRHKDMHQKLSTTGFGRTEDEQTLLREWVLIKFPLYYKVHEFLVGRANINPLSLWNSAPPMILP